MKQDPNLGLPPRVFLYTLDQIAMMIGVTLQTLKTSYVYFYGRSPGVAARDVLLARNIAPEGTTPDWRVAENELKRWLRIKGFRVYDRSLIRS